jgi:hypothetical protein
MNVKTTLELPAPLLHQVKTAALQCHTTMKEFFCEALKEKLARTSRVNTVRHRTVIPPPPKIPRKELEAINRKILDAAAEIHPDDWK